MLAAAEGGSFRAVVVWDTSRFSRLDSIDAAAAKGTLRKLGVHLESVSEGRIDWATSMGRIIAALKDESNNDYSVKLSGNTLRGRIDVLKQGYWPHGSVPFGYDRQYMEGSTVRATVKRCDKSSKPRNWRLKLVVNEEEADTVRFIFNEFAKRDVSMRQLGYELSKRGLPTPQGGKGGWTKDTIKDVLRNPCYVGDGSIGVRKPRAKEVFTRAEQTIVPNVCAPIVERATWKIAQTKLNERAEKGRKVYATKGSPLSGVVICGHCGYRMDKKSSRTKSGVVTNYFVCSSATKRPECGCKQWRAHEGELLRVVARELLDGIDFAVLKKHEAKPPTDESSAATVKAMKAQLAELDRRIKKGNENLLLAEPSMFIQLQATLKGWQAEAAKLSNTIRLLEATDVTDIEQRRSAWWIEQRPSLVYLADERNYSIPSGCSFAEFSATMDKLKPLPFKADELRGLLHSLNARLVCHWLPKGSRLYRLDTGRLECELTPSAFGAEAVAARELCGGAEQ
jgi:DNA invertase Pin-like site-specific DNA recombinase